MKLTLDWLRDFADLPRGVQAEDLVEVFENLGHEVEEWGTIVDSFKGVVIGRVLEVAPHPDADKIRLTEVDVGGTDPLDIVCGAWNFEMGAVVPVAVPGAVIQRDFEIGKREIRGVVSNGMICSEVELELGDDAAGILVLNDDYPEAAGMIGEDFSVLLAANDAWYDLSITPDRPDAMSVFGIAMDVAAYFDIPVKEPHIEVAETGEASAVRITITDEVACPRFVGREVRNIELGPSPHWMRLRLSRAGVRPISNVVDASNYAMIELGHPTHAFDLDRLGDTVVVRHAAAGERIVTLDGVERELLDSDIVVADLERPTAIAGVMGGADTEVHSGTSRILIEAAYWHPPSILSTSKRLGLRSEASSRFERGADPNFCAQAADRVAQLLEQISGAKATPGRADEYPVPIEPRLIELPIEEVSRTLGDELSGQRVAELLARLGFGTQGDDPLLVTVPTRRPDVVRPVDLIEEVARLHGYGAFTARVRTGRGGGLPLRERRTRRLREIVNGAGYFEISTFSFALAEDLESLGVTEDDPVWDRVRIVNPLRGEEGHLRTTLLPGLLRGAALNQARHLPAASLYEIGKVFLTGTGKLPEQPDRLGFVAYGPDVDVYRATGLWSLIASEMRLPDPGIEPATAAGYHPGRCGEATVAGTIVGVLGEVHPMVAEAFDLDGRIIAGEIDLTSVIVDRGLWQFNPPSTFPPVIFDLAWSMDRLVPAARVLEAVDESGGPWLEERAIFDVFEGESIGEGRKSLAVRVTLRAPDRTLTDDDVAPVRRSIARSVEEATDGTLRGEV